MTGIHRSLMRTQSNSIPRCLASKVQVCITIFAIFTVQRPFFPEAPANKLRQLVQLYDAALVMDQSICLCAALGAESMGIEKQIRAETGDFFQVNIWLQNLFRLHPARPQVLIRYALRGRCFWHPPQAIVHILKK